MTAPAADNRQHLPEAALVPLDTVRNRLAVLWLIGALLILGTVIAQTFGDRYGDPKEIWGWLLPNITPSLGLILSVLGASALDPLVSRFTVRKTFFRIAEGLSGVYLLLVLVTLWIPPADGVKAIDTMHTASLWLGPIQALVSSALGVLFVTTKPKAKAERESEDQE